MSKKQKHPHINGRIGFTGNFTLQDYFSHRCLNEWAKLKKTAAIIIN